jgi:hypothetical protein
MLFLSVRALAHFPKHSLVFTIQQLGFSDSWYHEPGGHTLVGNSSPEIRESQLQLGQESYDNIIKLQKI